MPSTWSQVILHVVFSTKNREPLIDARLQERLYPFIGGVVRDLGGSLWAIGGIEDHVHLLARWGTDEPISTLARDVKHRSSEWIHKTFPAHQGFAWQKGYAVFSVSKSGSDKVKEYIENQRERHAKMDYRTELKELLRLHDVEYDERYLD
jgi:putative transposase